MMLTATKGAERRARSEVIRDARLALEQNAYFRGRGHCIQMEEAEGRLVLRGRLPTFYLKQILQTVLRDVEGVQQIENRVSVD